MKIYCTPTATSIALHAEAVMLGLSATGKETISREDRIFTQERSQTSIWDEVQK